jgi:archaeosine synthase beta-subunit
VRINQAMVQIRSERPGFTTDVQYGIRNGRTFLHDGAGLRSAELTLIWFRTRGCTFDRRGECTMCNYGVGPDVDPATMVSFVEAALAHRREYDALYVSPAGSLFDSREVPHEALVGIQRVIRRHPSFSLSCESRPEFVSRDAVEWWTSGLSDRRHAMNIGLESSNDFVRQSLLAKRFDAATAASAIETLESLHVRSIVNVLIGAPSLTEGEALDDAVESARWAFSHGASTVVFFPANLKRWTVFEPLAAAGEWHPPSLCSRARWPVVVRRAHIRRSPATADVLPHVPPACGG